MASTYVSNTFRIVSKVYSCTRGLFPKKCSWNYYNDLYISEINDSGKTLKLPGRSTPAAKYIMSTLVHYLKYTSFTHTHPHRANTRYRDSLFTAICGGISRVWPIPVAAWYKAWVYGRSLTSIAGSNAAGGMDVVSCECCVPDFRLPPLFWAVIQRIVNWILGIWMLPIHCPETSARNYHYTLRQSRT